MKKSPKENYISLTLAFIFVNFVNYSLSQCDYFTMFYLRAIVINSRFKIFRVLQHYVKAIHSLLVSHCFISYNYVQNVPLFASLIW